MADFDFIRVSLPQSRAARAPIISACFEPAIAKRHANDAGLSKQWTLGLIQHPADKAALAAK